MRKSLLIFVCAMLSIVNVAYALIWQFPTTNQILFKNHGVAVGIILDDCLKCHAHDKYKEYNLRQCNMCHVAVPNPPTDLRIE